MIQNESQVHVARVELVAFMLSCVCCVLPIIIKVSAHSLLSFGIVGMHILSFSLLHVLVAMIPCRSFEFGGVLLG